MGEKEDLMALAFMVGGEIHNIKSTSENRGRFVSEGLPDPRQFVVGIANQDISSALNDSRKQTQAIQNHFKKEESKSQSTVLSSTNNDAILQQILNELKTINDVLRKLSNKIGI